MAAYPITASDDTPPLHVVCGIIRRGNLFLAAERGAGRPYQGLWEFPGGKVECGEQPVAALIRELAEELAIHVALPAFWKTVATKAANRSVLLHFFFVDDFVGTPKPVEGQQLRWVSAQEALELSFLPADIPIVHELAVCAAAKQNAWPDHGTLL